MHRELREKAGICLVVICATAHTVVGFYGLDGTIPAIDSSWAWTILTAAMVVMFAFGEPLTSKLFGVKTEVDPEVESWRDVDPSITARWETVQCQLGIDLDEPRAEITGFGEVLDQIEAAEAARLDCSIRAVRVALGERVMILMREALGPLAAELEYLRTEEHRIGVTVLNTFDILNQQRQYEQDAAAELLACSPI